MVSLQDVADAAGVSRSVASRALNHDREARISQATRRRVAAAAEELAYVPDHRARALRCGRSGALALVVPEVSNAIFAQLLAGVEDEAGRRGALVVLSHARDHAELSALVGGGRVDGVILQRPDTTTDEELRRLVDVTAPVVLFNSCLDGRPGSVVLDDEAGVRAALHHLVELGHRRIAFVGGRPAHDAARRRREAFRLAMHQHGLPVDDRLVVDAGWEAPDGAAGMAAVLDAGPLPSAVVVASVNAAVGASAAARRRGVPVPGDLSVVTLQDTWFAEYDSPPLTVVTMPMHQAGRRAARMVLDALEGSPTSDVVVRLPPPRLTCRGSTARRVVGGAADAPVRTPAPGTARAPTPP